MAIKKSDLYSSLWASCDELRGGMDASQYKDYVLFMLFIKYVSDKYADYDGFEPSVVIPKGASFKDMVALKGKPDIGDKINTQIIQPIIDANSKLARSDFPDFNDPNKLGEGAAKVERLGNLIGIFENPALDFSQNRAEHDDILGDAYEYLMRHFASQSGKSKGQFYTPSEVSRIMAKVIGIGPHNTLASTTAYDPTCGSGSLLLKVAAEADKHITLEGQEKDVTTAGLARMNMILHDFPTANIISGNTLTEPKFKDGEQLRTYDYVVANPPFSDKAWSTGLTLGEGGSGDRFQRFAWGVPPTKQGDYAYLLHIIRSLKSTGKGACILPHGVLFRGNAEAVIRQKLIRSGYLKAIIGLPANLFYGTGIPACILVLDKENATARKGIFMIDASKGFKKDGPKNRLREQDLHKIVDTFTRQDESDPRYARMVPFAEIADPKNDFNLNLPRYIDSTEPEDLQDIDGHLRGGIPDRDIEDVTRLGPYWETLPGLRSTLFQSAGRPGYSALSLPLDEVKPAIFGHPEFTAFNDSATQLFADWKASITPQLIGFDKESQPKPLIASLSESLLATFHNAPLLDAYDVYQHLMDYWAATMQDDCYLISAVGWREGALPREIRQVKNKDGKLVWPEAHDYKKGKRRFKSDLIPVALIIARFFTAERDAIAAMEGEFAALEQQLDEMREEHSGEDGLLAEVIEGEGEKQKITAKALKARLKEIGRDPDYAEERQALKAYAALLDQQDGIKKRLKAAQEELEAKLDAKYPKLSETEIKTLVVDDKWLATLAAAVQGELDRVSQTLTGRIRQLAERYATSLPHLTEEVATLAANVNAVDRVDLAFTFFDTQNNRGVPLHATDLLKAYHLRAVDGVPVERKEALQKLCARRWEGIQQGAPVMSHEQEFAPNLFAKFLWLARYWTGQRVVYGGHDALMEEFQKLTWRSEGDHATIPLYRSRHNRLGSALTMTRDGHSEIHTNRISLSPKAEDLPFAIRQPIQKGIGFFLYADKYSALLRRLVVQSTDSQEVRRFREVYGKLLMANSLFLREIFLLASLMYTDQFDDEKLWEFALWLEHALGAIRLEKQQVRYEAAQNFFKQDTLNLLDVIASAYRPEQVIAHLKTNHTHAETYADETIETGKGVQGIYKRAVLAYYEHTEVTSLRGKHAWITAKLNGGAA